MIVAQLIEKLQTMNPTATVAVEQTLDDGAAQWTVTTFGFNVVPGRDGACVLITIDD